MDNKLKQFPLNPLVRVSKPQTKPARSFQDVSTGEVWSEWAASFTQVEREILMLAERSS